MRLFDMRGGAECLVWTFNCLIICLATPFTVITVCMQAEPITPAAGSSGGQAGRPRTPDGKAGSSNSSSLGQCFGMGRTLEEAEQEERPLGVVGLRNLGGLFLHFPEHFGSAFAMFSLLGIC